MRPYALHIDRPGLRRQAGQTLVIALIVLGVLLALGFVFLGLVSRNIQNAGTSRQRSVASDLAEAGIRFAHAQMLNTEFGADWRPSVTPPLSANDPDFQWLRPTASATDLGGPDQLGPYTRVSFDQGRSLIRVRYAATDANLFDSNPQGPLRNPGRARPYLIIEAIGRPGRVVANDPTTTLQRSNFESRKVVAFVSIGIIEHARFITNKDRVSRPADLGFPSSAGILFPSTTGGTEIRVPQILGGSYDVFTSSGVRTSVPGGGSVFANAPIRVHGELVTNLNAFMGEGFRSTQSLRGAEPNSRLTVVRQDRDAAGNFPPAVIQQLANGALPDLDSRSPNFSTVGGAVRDGALNADLNGFSRGVGTNTPPSILRLDPDSRQNRYAVMTRDSGRALSAGNSGRFGHGRGVYVNNAADRQLRADEDGRVLQGASETLVYDWLNPNNGLPNSGWRGPFYVPRGASVQLLPDGFVITRDPSGPDRERVWRSANGAPSLRPGANINGFGPGDVVSSGTARFRLRTIGGRTYVLGQFSSNPATGVVVDISTAGDAEFQAAGQPFNGVLYFEGNVRVRGVIPTDQQITLVSNATIYIEGSITKGVEVGVGGRLNRPSRSALMLAAREYVAVNTTQFFGPSAGQNLEEANETPSGIAWNAVRMRSAGGSLTLRSEFLLNPAEGTPNANNPSLWTPFATNYTDGSGNAIRPSLLLSHTMDDGAGATSFISMDVNFGLADPGYQFQMTPANTATQYYLDLGTPSGSFIPMYGLGAQNWQRAPKFESTSFPLTDANFTFDAGTLNLIGGGASPIGRYTLRMQDTNEFSLRPNFLGGATSNDYLLGRAAIVPHDIRIEAAVFAEEGSFFVIPGPAFNPNPNDRRDTFLQAITRLGSLAAAQQERLESFGSNPEMPFYDEPLAVRVTLIGAISENMPPPIAQQAQWLRRWGWMPLEIGGTGQRVPAEWVPAGWNTSLLPYIPNLRVVYDPVFATGRIGGAFANSPDPSTLVRVDEFGRPLPPLPRLPVSPTLAYFGEVNP